MLSQSHAKFFSPVGSEKLVLQSVRANEYLAGLFEIQVMAISEFGDIDESLILGKNCHAEVKTNLGKTTYFSGQASSFSYLGVSDSSHHYAIVLRPTLWFLGHNKRYTIFQEKTVKDIVEFVLKRAGVTKLKFDLQGAYPAREYVVQYAESDLAFVLRLLEQDGIYYYFEHADGGETVVFVDDTASLKPGEPASLPFAYRQSGGSANAHREEVDSWTQSTRVASHKYISRDFNFKSPKNKLHNVDEVAPQRSDNIQERYVFPGLYDSEAEAKRLAKLRTEYMKGARERFSGTLDAIKVRAGCTLVLTKHPHEPYNQKYIAVASSWTVSTTDTRSSGGGDGWTLQGSLEFQRASLPFRPRFSVHKPVALGPHTARVVGPAGEEIWADQFGRVKVSFQWDRESKEDDRSSCFLRVMTPWAGSQRGFFALPRIGDEVLVWFLDGDPDRPIVAGSIFNGDNKSPVHNQPTHLSLRSRSTKGGKGDQFNELRFEDTAGQERVYVQAERNLTTLVKNDQDTEIRGGEKRNVKKSRNVAIDESDTLTVKKTITIEAGDKLEILVGQSKLTMTKDGSISVNGVKIKISGTAEVTAEAMKTAIKGKVSTDVTGLKTSVKGTMLELKADAIAQLSGALVKVG